MKHFTTLILLIFLSMTTMLFADTWTTSVISSNTTWLRNNDSGDGIYVVDISNDTLIVESAATLTIEPGVTVKFHRDVVMLIYGTLIAQGTATDSIIFTVNDAPGSTTEWGGIKLLGNGTPNKLIYCRIEYGDADNLLFGPVHSRTGGAIYCGENIDGTTEIKHSLIWKNKAFEGGGGIFCEGARPIIANNIIRDNSAQQYGGGIAARGSMTSLGRPTLTNNIIFNNKADGIGGGGLGLVGSTNVTAYNNLFYNNSSLDGSGGGILLYYSDNTLILRNSIVWGNSANSNNQIAGPANVQFSNIEGSYSGTGNIAQDPEFNNPGNYDFHFEATSPLVDAGTDDGAPAVDFDGNARPFDGNRDNVATTDIGPYEYINTPPQITSQPVTAATEEELYTYTVTAFDPDAAEELTFSLITAPAFLSINSNTGEISGTALTDDDAGDHTVTVQVADLNNATDQQTYTLTVTAVNDLPVVGDIPDQTIYEGESFASIVLDNYVNDEETPADQIVWSYSGNTELIVSISADRIATVSVPHPDWFGVETITFTARDEGGLTDSDAVTFTVINVNDPPVVSTIPDQTVAEGDPFEPITLDDYVNDVDNDDNEMTWTYSGNVNLNVTIGNNRVATVTAVDENWNGTEIITFKATDPEGLSDSTQVTFTVTPVNDPPVVSGIPDQTIDEGGSFAAINLNDYVSDVDNSAAEMTWSYSGNVELMVSIDENRIATIGIPHPDWFGVETITFTATDPEGLSGSDQAVFTVINVNDTPVAVNDTVSTPEDEAILIDVLNNDSDVDGDDLEVISVTDPANGTAAIQNGQQVLYTPDADFYGSDSFEYTISDGNGETASAMVYITVTPLNDPPVVSGIPDQTIDEGGSFAAITLDDYVSDVDNSAAEMTWSYSGNEELMVSIDENRIATITIPSNQWNGAETIIFTATDPEGLSGRDTVTFTVLGINDPPVVSAIPDQTLEEGTPFEPIQLDLYVEDIDDEKSAITWTVSSQVELTVTIDANRVATITPPNEQWNGSETIQFKATDAGGLSDSTTTTFTWTPVNDPPIILTIPAQTIDEGGSFAAITLDDYVDDVDNHADEMTWSISGQVELIVQIDNNRVATISTPSSHWNGSESIQFKVSDPEGLADSAMVLFTVNPVNDPPVISGPLPELSFLEDDSLVYAGTNWLDYVDDIDNPDTTLFYFVVDGKHVSALAKEASGLPKDNFYTFRALPDWFGRDTLELIVSDGELSDTLTFFVTVHPVNDAPEIHDLPASITFKNDTTAILELSDAAFDVDSPRESLVWSFAVSNDSLLFNFDPQTEILTLSAPDFAGDVDLIITLTDDSLASVSDTILVTVQLATSLGGDLAEGIPTRYELFQNYPNPFNPQTYIKFALPKAGVVKIEVFNIVGQKVITLLDETRPAGYHRVVFEANGLPSGLYFYRIEADGFRSVKRMVLVK